MRWAVTIFTAPSPAFAYLRRMKRDQDRPDDFVARRLERRPVSSTTKLRSDTWYNVEVRVRDISQSGFMAECAQPIQIGSTVSLDVPGIGPVHAQVRWQIGTRMGGLFLDPISLTHCEWTAVPAEAV
jgi:hypothetical protein